MAEHTPGPWRVPNSIPTDVVDSAHNRWIADCKVSVNGPPKEEQEANARLIAASPDLLAACEWIVQPDHAIGSNAEFKEKATEIARAAIAKAKGTP